MLANKEVIQANGRINLPEIRFSVLMETSYVLMNFRNASSSDMSPSLLSLANVSKASEPGGSLDKTPWSRLRTTPGFAGPADTRISPEEAAEPAMEIDSSGVGGTRMGNWIGEGEESSDCRDLLEVDIFS